MEMLANEKEMEGKQIIKLLIEKTAQKKSRIG
jgi:hypothetical protein